MTLYCKSMYISSIIIYVFVRTVPMALPHPKVLNLASMMTPFSSVSNCNFITSPHAGAPTRPGEKTNKKIYTNRVQKLLASIITSSYVLLLLVETSNIARVFVVVDDVVMVASHGFCDDLTTDRAQNFPINLVQSEHILILIDNCL